MHPQDTLISRTEPATWKWAVWAACAGALMFGLLLNFALLDPRNVAWLAGGDSAQSYLGWLFYRHEPWTFPLGAMHRLGMEQASSIVYSDSIPLFAIFFKLLDAILPSSFQYDGLWLCACYALQGYFACRLLALFTRNRLALTVGTLLFLLSPIMLLRAQAHLALTAHWIIVCAIYLYYAPAEPRRTRHWLILLWLAPLVHAYLMFMAYAIWIAYLTRMGVLERQITRARMWQWLAASICGSLLVMGLVGYFVGDMDVSAGGFGYYSLNLLSPFLPVAIHPFLVPTIAPAVAGQYEGFNYLGLGVVLGLLYVLAARLWPGRARRAALGWRHRPDSALIGCALLLTLLALSSRLTLGTQTLINVPIPKHLVHVVNTFRCSGRLFWPVYYLLVMAAVRGIAATPRRAAVVALTAMAVLQLADVWPFARLAHVSAQAKLVTQHFPSVSSPFWAQARARYAHIYVIPGDYQGDEYIAYESLAGTYRFAIDTAYYARLPARHRQRPRLQRHQDFLLGHLDPRGLYLVQGAAWPALKGARSLLPPDTGVGSVDGFTVIAPGWFANPNAGYLHRPERIDYVTLVPSRAYGFGSESGTQPLMLGGWSYPERAGTWSEGPASLLGFRVKPLVGNLDLDLDLMPYLPPAFPELTVQASIGHQVLARWVFARGRPAPLTRIKLPAKLLGAGSNVLLELDFNRPRSPRSAKESADPRKIAIQLHDIVLKSG